MPTKRAVSPQKARVRVDASVEGGVGMYGAGVREEDKKHQG